MTLHCMSQQPVHGFGSSPGWHLECGLCSSRPKRGSEHSPGIFIDPDADPAEAVEQLDSMLDRVSELRDAVATYRSYADMFGANHEDYSNLDMLEKEARARHSVWVSLHEFLEKSNDWTQGAIVGPDGSPRLVVATVQ